MQRLVFTIAVIYIGVYILKTFVGCFLYSKWDKNDSREFFLFLVSLIYISFFAVPSKSDDLYRWYANVNWYRLGAPKNYDFTHKVMPVQTNAIFLYNLSMKLVAKTNNNSFLQVLWLCINYGALYYIVSDFCKTHMVKKNEINCFIVLYFGMMPYFFSLTGIRSAAISSMFALGVYLSHFKKKKCAAYIIIILSVFVHQSAIMFMMIWCIYKIGKKRKMYRIIVGWTLAINIAIEIAMSIPIEIFQLIGRKTYYYFYEYSNWVDIRLKIVLGILILLIYLGLHCVKHSVVKNREKAMQEYFDFFECVVLFCVGAFFNLTIFYRAVYLVAYCMFPYNYILYKRIKEQNLLSLLEVFFATGLNVYFLITLNTYVTFCV